MEFFQQLKIDDHGKKLLRKGTPQLTAKNSDSIRGRGPTGTAVLDGRSVGGQLLLGEHVAGGI